MQTLAVHHGTLDAGPWVKPPGDWPLCLWYAFLFTESPRRRGGKLLLVHSPSYLKAGPEIAVSSSEYGIRI